MVSEKKKTRMKNNSSDVKKKRMKEVSLFLPVLLLDPVLILLFSKVEEDAVFIT